MTPRIAIIALLVVAAPAFSALRLVAADFDCHENCYSCNGPGEYECTICENEFCMEDEQYRINHYEGEGRCWNVTCTVDKSAGSSTAVSMLNWVMLGATVTMWMAFG